MTPTRRSLVFLRRLGYLCEPVERWVPVANVRRDLFRCIDVVAVCPHRHQGVLGVQATTLPNVPARLTKARARPELRTWLLAGNGFQVHGWYLRGGEWRVKVVAVEADDLEATVLVPRLTRRQKATRQALLEFGE